MILDIVARFVYKCFLPGPTERLKELGLCPDSVARECFSSFFKLSKGRRKEKRETIYMNNLELKSCSAYGQMLPSAQMERLPDSFKLIPCPNYEKGNDPRWESGSSQ
jgi:hypothetical protein